MGTVAHLTAGHTQGLGRLSPPKGPPKVSRAKTQAYSRGKPSLRSYALLIQLFSTWQSALGVSGLLGVHLDPGSIPESTPSCTFLAPNWLL
jgi:hypothetical protein